MSHSEMLLIALIALVVGVRNADRIARAMRELADAIGGGPKPPTHPMGADDAVILNRRRIP